MRKKVTLIIVSALIAACLLLSLAAYLLYKSYTREVENSNWSMEGEWIAFQCTPGGLAPKSSLYLVRPDGSEVMRLTTDKADAGSPSWSPDGKEIVFEAPRGELAKLRWGAKKLTRLSITNQPYSSEYGPAWSPDGQWIAFISSPIKGPSTLFRVSSDGKILEPVLEDVAVAPIIWTPDGRWIIYFESYWHARKVRIDGSGAQDIVSWSMENPAWSPDGKLIAFNDYGHIYVAQGDGSEKTQLTDLPAGALNPAWSPDGQWIVFSYFEPSPPQLYKIRADGSDLQQITDINCSALFPDWIKMPGSK
jgi:Tol biopolymer transport system component